MGFLSFAHLKPKNKADLLPNGNTDEKPEKTAVRNAMPGRGGVASFAHLKPTSKKGTEEQPSADGYLQAAQANPGLRRCDNLPACQVCGGWLYVAGKDGGFFCSACCPPSIQPIETVVATGKRCISRDFWPREDDVKQQSAEDKQAEDGVAGNKQGSE